MKYLTTIALLLFVGSVDAQVVVSPQQRPIVINIAPEASQKTTEPPVEAPEISTAQPSDKQIELLTKQVEVLAKQVEALTKKQMVKDDSQEIVQESFTPYPTKPNGSTWNMGSIPMNSRNLVRHLMGEIGSTQHRGTFAREYLEYLESLPDGFYRLRALHSDDHNNRVRQVDYKMFGTVQDVNTIKQFNVVPKVRYYSNCPNGKCPR